MRNEVIAHVGGAAIVAMDTISAITAKDRGAIIICGSHGGAISGVFAAQHPPALLFFNDAGGGKNRAGIAALSDLDGEGIPAATVAHSSAWIGDSLDAWETGVVSYANEAARQRGISPGQFVRDAVKAFQGN